MVRLLGGDCLAVMAGMADASIDAIVTDPPYELGFMGRKWDSSGIAFDPSTWAAALRVLKPGGHLVAFGAPKNYHRLACAIEDAGFEIRDSLMWVFGSGFPKSLDVSKAIDKSLGAEREKVRPKSVISHQRNIGNRRPYMDDPDHMTVSDDPASDEAAEWQGWGTALKPAYEPIILARKPLIGTVAETVLAHGTGALNIDACRVGVEARFNPSASRNEIYGQFKGAETEGRATVGRWPANLVHDGSEEVLAGFPESKGAAGTVTGKEPSTDGRYVLSGLAGRHEPRFPRGDSGSAARFFYCAKASKTDRAGSKHPTVKPIALMRWLVRLITPPGGTVLDPFAGSGTTGQAAMEEGFDAVLIEREAEYLIDIGRRLRIAA